MIQGFKDITKDTIVDCDVCVVGSGAGGAVVAKELREQGLDVVLIEEGGYYQTKDFLLDDPIQSCANLYRNGGATVIFGTPNIMLAEGRCVGGSTVINGGMCWRTPEKIMQSWRDEKGMVNFSAQKMDAYFSRVEKMVSAKSMVPEAINRESELLKEGAQKLGFKYETNVRSQDHCVGTNLCISGCPQDAKKSMVNSYIPLYLQQEGRLFTDCRVQKVLTKGRKAVGIKGWFVNPITKQKKYRLHVKATRVVIACGAIQTPALLLKSGIRDQSKLLGRNLIVHPNGKVIGVFEETVNSWSGVNQGYQISEFFDEGILMAVNSTNPGVAALAMPIEGRDMLNTLKNEFHHIAMGGVLVEDTGRGRVRVAPFDTVIPTYNLNDYDLAKTIRGVALLAEVFFAAGAKKCYLPFADLNQIHSVDDIPKIYAGNFRQKDLELLTVHIMGTAQMGGDPYKSVLNPFGEFHNIKGLYVADASVFPTSIGVNPQITIMALATRTAEHIFETYS